MNGSDGAMAMQGLMGGGVGLRGPLERNGKYVLEFGSLLLEVDPAAGARVTRFAYRGQNVLTGPELSAINWGSTFWPSPQAQWEAPPDHWPPIPEVDSGPYSASVLGDSIVTVGSPSARGSVSVRKKFTPLLDKASIDVEYTLKNENAVAASWAPWEISRVASLGLTFFPTGLGAPVLSQLPTTEVDGITWYRNDPTTVQGTYGDKFVADGAEGWLAHVTTGNLLFLKTFPDIQPAQQAPAKYNEGEIAIYASQAETAASAYVEIEPQGPYTLLQPGESVTWTVRWYLRELPPDVRAVIGNPELVAFVRALARR
jgi:hypothetical protein